MIVLTVSTSPLLDKYPDPSLLNADIPWGTVAAIGFGLAVILVILLVSFVLTRLVPGDPIVALVGDFPAPPEFIEERRRAFGLDQPVYIQALIYFKNLFLGDFGYSFVNRLPVMELILRRAGNTLLLVVPSLAIGSVIAVMLASLAIRRPGGRLDTALTSLILFVDSIPIFWVGQIFIIVFAVQLGLFPVQGMFDIRSSGSNVVLDLLWHWALPGSIVSAFAMVSIARVARVSMIEVSRLDFITTAGTNFSNIADLKIDQANLGATGTVAVSVNVTSAATQAQVDVTAIPAAVAGVAATGTLTGAQDSSGVVAAYGATATASVRTGTESVTRPRALRRERGVFEVICSPQAA